MSTIKSKEDSTYVVNSDDLIAVVNNAGTVGKGVTPDQILLGRVREKLSSARTYYVRTDGNDSNSGLINSSGGAFLTIQAAVDIIKNTIDLQGITAAIVVADGTYTDPVLVDGPFINGKVAIQGNLTTPSNCIVSVTGDDCFKATNGAHYKVRGFKLQTTTSGVGLLAELGSSITSGKMDFGDCVGSQIEAGTSSTVFMSEDYSITGDSISHWHASFEGEIVCGTITITVTGTPDFSSYFAGAAVGSISVRNVTFSSTSATGPRFLSHKNGTIDIGANNIGTFLPGDSAGTTNTGGVIATTDISWTPVLTFASAGDLSVSYATQNGTWSKLGDLVFVTCEIVTSAFTHTTASGDLYITGLPWASNGTALVYAVGATVFQGITKAGYTQISSYVTNGSSIVKFPASGSGQTIDNVEAGDMPTGNVVVLRFSMVYRSATT